MQRKASAPGQASMFGEAQASEGREATLAPDRIAATRISQLEVLRTDLRQALALAASCDAIQQPFANDFYRADRALRALWDIRHAGGSVDRTTMTDAYDARLHAGHAWNPSRTALKEADQWAANIEREINHLTKSSRK